MKNRIRELRKQKDLTMKQLGEIIGVAESTISQYETGKRQPDNETLLQLGEFFDVTLEYLLCAENEKRTPLTQEQGERIIQSALKDTGLLDENGSLSEAGEKTVSEFLRSNAQILKQLLDK